MKRTLLLSLCLALAALGARASAQAGAEVEVVGYEALEATMAEPSENVRVFNFWATWCRPCVKEMPYFQELHGQTVGGRKVEVVFVSLDMSEQAGRVEAFAEKRDIESRMLLLDEVDFDSWMPKIDGDWQGDIPATLILAPNGERAFHAKEFEAESLRQAVEAALD